MVPESLQLLQKCGRSCQGAGALLEENTASTPYVKPLRCLSVYSQNFLHCKKLLGFETQIKR